MDSVVKKNPKLKETLHLISTIISWTIFVLLSICAVFLLYYFIATKLYSVKGDKYEPKFSLYTIISPSMTPNINVYDVIVDVRVDSEEDIKIGDVITFLSTSPETAGKIITHRVVSIIKDSEGNYSYQTKGDFNPIEDTGSVPFKNIIGKVAIKIPQLGRVQFFVASKMGWLLVIVLPALYIIFKDLTKLLKLNNKNKKTRKQGKLATLLHKPLYLPYKGKIFEKKELSNEEDMELPKLNASSVASIEEENNLIVTPLISEEENELPNLSPSNVLNEASEDEEDWELPDLK